VVWIKESRRGFSECDRDRLPRRTQSDLIGPETGRRIVAYEHSPVRDGIVGRPVIETSRRRARFSANASSVASDRAPLKGEPLRSFDVEYSSSRWTSQRGSEHDENSRTVVSSLGCRGIRGAAGGSGIAFVRFSVVAVRR